MVMAWVNTCSGEQEILMLITPSMIILSQGSAKVCSHEYSQRCIGGFWCSWCTVQKSRASLDILLSSSLSTVSGCRFLSVWSLHNHRICFCYSDAIIQTTFHGALGSLETHWWYRKGWCVGCSAIYCNSVGSWQRGMRWCENQQNELSWSTPGGSKSGVPFY
jgi:hypothetical protein